MNKEVGNAHVDSAAAVVILSCAAFGLYCAILSPEKESCIALWIFASALAWQFVWGKIFASENSVNVKIFAYVLVGFSIILSFLGFFSLPVFIIALASSLYFGGTRLCATCALPFAVWILALPDYETLHFAISYPLRIIVANMSSLMLGLFGISAEVKGSLISAGGYDIAVTAACSGIEQLEAMFIAAWIIAAYMHKSPKIRILHFSTILPIIIASNSLRLALIIISQKYIGDTLVFGFPHEAVGILTVVLETLAFIGTGFLFEKDEDA